MWWSQAQRIVTQSSTEAKYLAMVTCVNEMHFLFQVCETLDIKVELPMKIHVDNTGAIDLAHNWSTSPRSRHIGVRYNVVKQMR